MGESESVGRKTEGAGGIKMAQAGNDDPAHRAEYACQQQFRNPSDAGDLSVEQCNCEHDYANCYESGSRNQPAQLHSSEQGQLQAPSLSGKLMF